MTVVAVVEKPLPLRYLQTSDIESVIPVGCLVRTECRCSLEVELVVGLTSALTWATMAGLAILAQVQALWPSLLGSFEELLLSD